MQLTEEQLNFSQKKNRDLLLLASAGSGKTGTLVHFIADKVYNNVKPNDIISFSFTRKAAHELKERVEDFFKKGTKQFDYISTIHSFCWNAIIKEQYNAVGYTSIPTIVFELPEEFLELDHKQFGRKTEKNKYYNRVRDVINEDIQKESMQKQETIRLLDYLIKNNLIMFDYMIHIVNYLIEENPTFFTKKFGKMKYIIIDEAQDLNRSQYNFLKLLKQVFSYDDNETYLVMVGDFKQSIYKFRGADPEIIKDFKDSFNPEVDFLSFNFRSASAIVEFANAVASTIDLGDEKLNESQLQEVGRNDLEGDIINIYDVEDFLEELKLLEHPLHEFCILTRTNQAVKTLGRVLGLLDIPYYLHTEFDILKRAEVKIFMSLLNLATNGYNRSVLTDVVKQIKGGIPLNMVKMMPKIHSMYDLHSLSNLKHIKEILEVHDLLKHNSFNKAIKILSKILEKSNKSAEMIEYSLNRFLKDLTEVKNKENLSSWTDALEEMLFEAQFLNKKQENKVQLMTTHKAKGLQWKSVMFVYDFSILEQVEHDLFDIEEEKRVVYTGITRPEENLIIWKLDTNMHRMLFSSGPQGNKFENFIKKSLKYGNIDKNEFKV